jgi:hypothetical protein
MRLYRKANDSIHDPRATRQRGEPPDCRLAHSSLAWPTTHLELESITPLNRLSSMGQDLSAPIDGA